MNNNYLDFAKRTRNLSGTKNCLRQGEASQGKQQQDTQTCCHDL